MNQQKEINAISIELRTMRINKMNLGKEIQDLINKKLRVLDDITTVNKNRDKASEAQSAETTKLGSITKKVKEQESKLTDKSKKIEQEIKSLAEAQNKLIEEGNRIDGLATKTKEGDDRLKQQNLIYSKKKSELEEGKRKLGLEKDELLKESKAIDKKYSDLADEAKKSEREKDVVAENLSKSIDIKHTLEGVKSGQEKDRIELERIRQEINIKQKELKDEDDRLKLLGEEINETKLSLLQKEKSMGRIADDLVVREQEAEIEKIRVKKLIRDKGISKELEDLKKELDG